MDEQTELEEATRLRWESGRKDFEAYAREAGESPSEYDGIVRSTVRHARATYQKDRAFEELDEYHVDWDRISPEEALALQELVAQNPQEREMQAFLKENPKFLVQALTGGHGRYQIAKPRLGDKYVPDFLLAEMDSIGIHWYAVALESHRSNVFRHDGLPRQEVNHALGQIRDWREWFSNNIEYARKPPDEHGLGLVGIQATLPGMILIGRRSHYPERYNEFRRSQLDRERIEIHSYDWLVDIAKGNSSRRLILYAKPGYLHGTP